MGKIYIDKYKAADRKNIYNSEEKVIAIVLAGGRGSRMNSSIPKQFMNINDRPVIYYSLNGPKDRLRRPGGLRDRRHL